MTTMFRVRVVMKQGRRKIHPEYLVDVSNRSGSETYLVSVAMRLASEYARLTWEPLGWKVCDQTWELPIVISEKVVEAKRVEMGGEPDPAPVLRYCEAFNTKHNGVCGRPLTAEGLCLYASDHRYDVGTNP